MVHTWASVMMLFLDCWGQHVGTCRDIQSYCLAVLLAATVLDLQVCQCRHSALPVLRELVTKPHSAWRMNEQAGSHAVGKVLWSCHACGILFQQLVAVTVTLIYRECAVPLNMSETIAGQLKVYVETSQEQLCENVCKQSPLMRLL